MRCPVSPPDSVVHIGTLCSKLPHSVLHPASFHPGHNPFPCPAFQLYLSGAPCSNMEQRPLSHLVAPATPRTPGRGPAVFILSRTVVSMGRVNSLSRMLKQWINQAAQAVKLPFRSWPALPAGQLGHRREFVCARELHAYTEHRRGPRGVFRRIAPREAEGARGGRGGVVPAIRDILIAIDPGPPA